MRGARFELVALAEDHSEETGAGDDTGKLERAPRHIPVARAREKKQTFNANREEGGFNDFDKRFFPSRRELLLEPSESPEDALNDKIDNDRRRSRGILGRAWRRIDTMN